MSSKLKAGTSTSGAVLEADTTGILELQTGSTPTTAITVDTSQNVGVGTASPSTYGAKLAVYDAGGNGVFSVGQPTSYSQIQSNGYDLYINQNVSGAGSNAGSTIFRRGGSQTESMRIGADGNNTYVNYSCSGLADAVQLYTGYSGTSSYFALGTKISGTLAERMRIDSSGNLLVGSTSGASDRATIASPQASINTMGLVSTDNSSGGNFVVFRNSAYSAIGSISRVATTNAVAYNTTSDERLKSNIEYANPVLEKLMDVKVRQFDWTEGDLHQDAGFIAQELEPLLSGIVTKGKTQEDMWQLDYSRLTPYLVKAIQELNAKVTDLEAKLGAK